MDFRCFLCPKKFIAEKTIISHLKFDHFVKDNTIEMKCLVKGDLCSARFYTYSSLKSHLKKCTLTNKNQNRLNCCEPEPENEANIVHNVLFSRVSEHTNCFSLENTHKMLRSENANNNIFQLETKTENPNKVCEETMNKFLESFNDEMCNLKLNHEQLTAIYNLCSKLVENKQLFIEHMIQEDNGFDVLDLLKISTTFVKKRLSECSTKYSRAKNFGSNKLYVPPDELVVGLRSNMERIENSVSVPRLIPCKFHYIPITSTIIALFRRDDFRREYFEFNAANGQRADNGVYCDYISGSQFKSSELFSVYPNSLQIELATDDFDVCNGLGSKATMHKLCPVYVLIKNLPLQFSSKLDAISLASLCYSNDIVTKFTDFNDMWLFIVQDVSQIENGIDIGGGEIIRGTVTYVSSDNLGQNTALGFVKNFSKAEYCCRFCTCSQSEMKTLCKEDQSKIRTLEQYNEHIKIVNNSTHVDLKESKGVVRYCVLNDLKYFNIIDSMVPDILHDLNEGTIPFALKNMFLLLIEKKVFTEKEINDKISNFDYGHLNRSNIPSNIGLQKRSLGQNAMQMLCLFYHMPYIFYEKRNNIEINQVWICIESLLHIVQIVYSMRIEEVDLQSLEYWTEIHLTNVTKCFKSSLIRKHHFMTHYARVIRAMGPIKAMSMIRKEAKHKVLKSYAAQTQNFTNITKTISERHQQHICMTKNIFTNELHHGKNVKPIDVQFFDVCKHLFEANNILNNQKILETSWLTYNAFNYKPKFFIFSEKCLFQIEKIVICSSEYFLFCSRFECVTYDEFLNSIEMKKSEPVEFALFNIIALEQKNVYESKKLNSKFYIILETLDLKSLYS